MRARVVCAFVVGTMAGCARVAGPSAGPHDAVLAEAARAGASAGEAEREQRRRATFDPKLTPRSWVTPEEREAEARARVIYIRKYGVGSRVTRRGTLCRSWIAGFWAFVSGREAVPPRAVFLAGERTAARTALLGKKVRVTGVLDVRWLGSNRPRSPMPRQPQFFMREYDMEPDAGPGPVPSRGSEGERPAPAPIS